MKLKNLVFILFFNLSLIPAANADIFLFSHTKADLCANLEGPWAGGGSITAKVVGATIKCEYQGKALVSRTGDNTFTTAVNFHHKSGSHLCPDKQTYSIPGSCDSKTGEITMKSDDADLTGILENNGTKANLKGTVKISIKKQTVKANVNSMILFKQ